MKDRVALSVKWVVLGIAASSVTRAVLAESAAEAVQPGREPTLSSRCEELADTTLLNEDALARITSADVVGATDQMPAYCRVRGYATPQIGFQIGLPTDVWNGKFMEIGCGGSCGTISFFWPKCEGALKRGYACIVFDAGHSAENGLWAYNNLQAQVDFGFRAAHVTALVGKAAIRRHYGIAPKYSYFSGCSSGGRSALVEAQRFPWDFDGIISGAPWIDDTDSAMNFVWANRVLKDGTGRPLLTRRELAIVQKGALEKCDLDDGIRDGIIGDPVACKFDPHDLVCKSDGNSQCLTAAQADAVTKVYMGPVDSKGRKLYVGGAVPGSETGWVDELLAYIRTDGRPGGSEGWALEYFRYMVMPPAGSSWNLADFDFDVDRQRFSSGVHESLLNAGNPDLRKFKSAGGKLIIYQGWNDQSDLPQKTIDYYETVERVMGGRAPTQDFARLFVVPGMLHCTGGDGAFAIDYLSYLERWVEHDQPPVKLIGAHVDGAYLRKHHAPSGTSKVSAELSTFLGALALTFPLSPEARVSFTRPIYPYPVRAKYNGTGDQRDAANFSPIEP